MATQSILRNSIASPTRTMFKAVGSARSIAKRPDALPLSPALPYAASFSIQTSPHVRFPPSASSMAIFTTASCERALSPFKERIEDPRSPKIKPAAKQNALSFAALCSNQTTTRPSRTLAQSLASYPRSPYPSAPLTSSEQVEDSYANVTINHRTRSVSLELPRRNKKGLTLAPPYVPPSPPGPSIFSPKPFKKPVPLDLESRLSEAFWEAVFLEEPEKTGDDEVMVTALEYFPSSAESGGKMDISTRTSYPQITYSGPDGALWSPGSPRPGVAISRIRESLMSPGKRSSFSGIVRRDITAPSPNDPFAAFPSFAAAIEMQGVITYPSRAVLESRI